MRFVYHSSERIQSRDGGGLSYSGGVGGGLYSMGSCCRVVRSIEN